MKEFKKDDERFKYFQDNLFSNKAINLLNNYFATYLNKYIDNIEIEFKNRCPFEELDKKIYIDYDGTKEIDKIYFIFKDLSSNVVLNYEIDSPVKLYLSYQESGKEYSKYATKEERIEELKNVIKSITEYINFLKNTK